MLWLKVMIGLLTGLYGLFAIARFPIVLPVLIVAYLTFFYAAGFSPNVSVGNISIYGWDLLFLASIFNIGYRVIIERQEIEPTARPALIFLILFVGYLEFSELYYFLLTDVYSLENFIRRTIKNCFPLIALSMYLDLVRARSEKFWWYLLACVGLMGVAAGLRAVFGLGSITSSGTSRYLRIEGILIMNFMLVYGLFAPIANRMLRKAIVVFGVGIAVLSSSRSVYLSVAAIFGIYGVYLFMTRQLGKTFAANAIVLFFGIAGAILTITISKPEFVTNFFTRAQDTFDTENQTSADRLNKWNIALETAKENPLGGTKLNLLRDYYGNRESEAWAGAMDIATAHARMLYLGEAGPHPPHNMLVNMVSRNGLFALSLFSAMVIAVVRYMQRMLPNDIRYLAWAWMGGNFVLLMFNNHTNFDASLSLFISLIVFPLSYSYGMTKVNKVESLHS